MPPDADTAPDCPEAHAPCPHQIAASRRRFKQLYPFLRAQIAMLDRVLQWRHTKTPVEKVEAALTLQLRRYDPTDTSGWSAWLEAVGGYRPSPEGWQSLLATWTPGTGLAPPTLPQLIQRQ
jgi:hypothetical protein